MRKSPEQRDKFPIKVRLHINAPPDYEDGAPLISHREKKSHPTKLSKMDGGASSSDAFRLPSQAQVLVHPFGNGLVLRYGYTMSLVACMASLVGMTAELPPSMEAPFELLYFVAMDNLGTPITALRAVLKDGLTVPGRPAKALVIEKLQTREVYQKQGLATNLINFVKDIARAHGIGLYVSCELNAKTFWELRGFEEESQLRLKVCENDEDLAVCMVLLRAGELFSEYLPETGFQMSSVRNFCHFGGLPHDTATTVPPNYRENSPKTFSSTGSTKREAPTEAGAVGGIAGEIATPRDNAGVGHQSQREEEARWFLAAADAGASLSDDDTGPGGGLGPYSSSCVSTSSTAATAEAVNAVSTEDTSMSLEWPLSVLGQPGSAAMAAVTAVGGDGDVESGEWNPEPAIEDVALVSYSRETLAPVGQYGGSRIPTIDEQEEAQIQLAIKLSLSKADDFMASARRSSGSKGDAVGVKKTAAEAFPPAPLVNDTGGNEDPRKSSTKRKEVPSPGGVECVDRRTRRRNEDGTSTPQESWSVCAGVGSNATTLDWERWRPGDRLSPRQRVRSMGPRVNASLDGTYQVGAVGDGGFDFGVSVGEVEAQGGAEDESAGLEGILAAVSWEKDGDDVELMQAVEASRQEASHSPVDAAGANDWQWGALANLNER